MKKQRKYFSRQWLIYCLLIFISLAVFSKLFYLQVLNASELKARGASFWVNGQTMVYERGSIADAQGNILAKSVPAKDIYADPNNLLKNIIKNNQGITEEEIKGEIDDIAGSLAQILGKDKKELSELLAKDLSWVSIARQVDIDKAKKIGELAIPGIGFTDTFKRIYPAGLMASSVLGIVNMAGDGAEGIEYYYNSELKGEKEFKAINLDSSAEDNNVYAGYNLTLTLDATIQHLVEQELDKIMEESQPQRAVILAMDPMSGKILGMGSRPTFDPNDFSKTKPEERKNLALSMIYEPGSTFKIITGAAALEENVVTPTQVFNDPGYYRVNGRTITNWDSDRKANGDITFAEGMERSSNVVLAKVGGLLGKDTFYTYLKSFGFGSRTKIDIAGEETGLLIEKSRIKDLELATMSFGQANLVTPIQLLTAINAVANGGNLYQPYILDKITNKEGQTLLASEPKVVREVISPTTSKTMTDILVNVVNQGTGGRAKIPGIKVAGKTGTAQKIDPETGTYSSTDFVTSFVGYAPADQPKIAVLVALDAPHGPVIQGGTLAGPHVKKIIESTLQYYGIPVSANTPSDIQNLSPETIQEKPAVNQPDKPVTELPTPGKGEVLVPDLTGMTMRQSGEQLSKLDLRYKFSGSGLAYQQFPEAGKIVNQGDTIEVIFSKEKSDSD